MAEQAESTLMQDLHDSVGSQNDQTENEIVEKEVETKEVSKDQSEVSTITEEFAKKAGLPTSFVGKSMDELPKAIRNLQANYTQKSQALSELGKKVEQLEKSIMSQATKAEKEETKEIIEEIPDPVTDRQGFNRWLENRDKRKESDLEKKIGDMFEKKFGNQIKTVEDYTNKQRENQIMTSIMDSVDEGTDVDNLILEWGEANGVRGNDEEIKYWFNHPEQMAKSVINFYKASKFEELSLKKEKEIGDEVVKKTSKTIKEINQKKSTDLNSVKRESKESKDPLMETLIDMVSE